MNDLRTFFDKNKGRVSIKWENYFKHYETHFSKYREAPINFLEIGVSNGGSLEMWKEYFHNNSMFYGIDIEPRCKSFEDEKTKIFIGSQKDQLFLQNVMSNIPDLDIVLDDGGHTMMQQRVSFELLFPKLKDGGLYIIEDTHTSYEYSYGGGFRRRRSFIEYSKRKIDNLYGFQLPGKFRNKKDKYFTENIEGIHFYNGLIIFEKRKQKKYDTLVSGSQYLGKAPEDTFADKTAKKFNKLSNLIRHFIGL